MSGFAKLKEQRQARLGLRPVPTRPATSIAQPPDSQTSEQNHPGEPSQPPKDPSAQLSPLPQEESVEEPTEHRLAENSNLQVRQIANRGRGIVWLPAGDGSSCRRGTVLLRLRPQAAALSSSLLPRRCSYCFRSGFRLQRCSACKQVKYCQADCQRKDWPQHKDECKALQAFARRRKAAKAQKEHVVKADDQEDADSLDEDEQVIKQEAEGNSDEPGTSIRAMARAIWAQSKASPSDRGAVQQLLSHRADMDAATLQQYGNVSVRLAHYLTGATVAKPGTNGKESAASVLAKLGFATATDLLEFVCKFAINSIALTDSDLSSIGVCLQSTSALLNHSCVPNAAVVFPFGGRQEGSEDDLPLNIVAIRDIEAGEEVTISYADAADRYDERQRILKERYLFNCSCPSLCSRTRKMLNATGEAQAKAKWRDPREAAWCPQRCGGWVSRPIKQQTQLASAWTKVCNGCKRSMALDRRQISEDLERGNTALEAAETALNASDPGTAWKHCSSVLADLVERYPPSSQPLFSLLRVAQTALIELGSASLPAAEDEQSSQSRDVASVAELDQDAAGYFFEEATRMGMLHVAGCQASTVGPAAAGGPIYSEGHPARAIALATLAKLVLVEFQQAEEGSGRLVSKPSRLPSVLKNAPSIPQAARIAFAQQILVQAIAELDIAFGRNNEGGETGKDLRRALRELEQEQAMMAEATQGLEMG